MVFYATRIGTSDNQDGQVFFTILTCFGCNVEKFKQSGLRDCFAIDEIYDQLHSFILKLSLNDKL